MKKILISSFFMAFSSASFAKEKVSCAFTSPEGTQACFVDMNLIQKNFGLFHKRAPCIGLEDNSIRSLANRTNVVALHKDFSSKGANCSGFITTSTGKPKYGEYGKIIVDYLKERGDDNIFFSNHLPGMLEMPQICPKWKKLTRAEKENFWVYTFAAIAFDESKCVASAKNLEGSNGVAAGLTQMDQKKSGRSWRGPDCKADDIMKPSANLRCALNIMEELLKGPKGEYKSSGHIFAVGKNVSYWQKLKQPNGGEIGHLMKTNPLCR